MPLTYTGRAIRPLEAEAPSLVDIGVGLSRMPRFAGQTRRWYSVLDHTMFGDAIINSMSEYVFKRALLEVPVRVASLAWLLHDAHEAMTGDVPTDFKTATFKELQRDLDDRIYGRYFGLHKVPDGALKEFLAKIDARCLRAEAQEVGPPITSERLRSAFGHDYDTNDDAAMLEILLEHGGLLGNPPAVREQEKQPQVTRFVDRVLDLL